MIPTRVFNITAYGATATSSDNTTAIQNTINAAETAGGGVVEIPAASKDWECGPITLSNSIDLQIDSGATLQMLAYGTWPNAAEDFITCNRLTNVEVSGAGTIDGQGAAWWAAYTANNAVQRPYGMIGFTACTKAAVIGITLTNPPNTHIDFGNECTDVTVNGITINTPVSPNADGIDMSAETAVIENSSIADGDDNIAIGGTSGQASSNVLVTNDAFGIGHGLSIGSYTSGGVNGLTVSNCTFNGTTAGIRLKCERGRGGLVENLNYYNITMTNVEYPININSYYNDGSVPSTPTDPAQPVTSTTPIWENITISNLTSTTTSGQSNYSGSYCGIIWGLPEEPVIGVTLSNVVLSARYGMDINHVRGVTFDSTCKITALGGGGTEISTNNGAAPDTPYDAVVLASNYTDQDLGSPATAGTPLYNPDTGLWSVVAGGTGIGGASDQFTFDSTVLSGNATYFAKLTSLTPTTASAGVMFRDSTNTAASAFAAVLETPSSGLEFIWRASNGTTAATPTTVAGITAPIWVELVRSGNNFTANYSSNGTAWTQIGVTESVTLSTSALAGLAVAANSSSTTATAGFSNLAGPSITTAAASSPQPATGTSANLSVAATETGSTLTYTWSLLSGPTGATAPIFSVNGTSAAKNTTATFFAFGVYEFLLTVTDSNNVSTTAILGVGVNETPASVTVSPATVSMAALGTKLFTASATDQFGATFVPVFAWSLAAGSGTENSSFGLYTAPSTTTTATIKATAGGVSGTATATVILVVANAAAASPNPATSTYTVLSALGAENGSNSGLTYTWASTGPASVSYSVNGSNAASNTIANFTKAGTYQFTVTISDSSGLSVASVVSVTVNQTATSISITPSSATVNDGQSKAFAATAFDQFGTVLATQPTFTWTIDGGGVGGVDSSGNYTAPASGSGSANVRAAVGAVSSAATVTVGFTTIHGTGGNDNIRLVRSGSLLNVYYIGTLTYSAAISALGALTVNTSTGNDVVTVDFSGSGSPVPSAGITVDGGGGTDSLIVTGTSGGDTVSVNGSSIIFNGSTINYQNLDSIAVNAGSGADVLTQTAQPSAALSFSPSGPATLNINGGTFAIPASAGGIVSVPFSTLSIAAGASVSVNGPVDPANHDVLVLGNLSNAGLLDLGANDLILQAGGASGLTQLTNQLASGFNAPSGYWNGPTGIISSAAANDSTYLTTLGIMENGDGSSFDNQPSSAGDVLVKYTYYGDADLNGTVNGADYQQIDNGFGASLTGWKNGDFNYDGVVDGSDYSLIDNAFNELTADNAGPLAITSAAPVKTRTDVSSSIPTFSTTPTVSQATNSAWDQMLQALDDQKWKTSKAPLAKTGSLAADLFGLDNRRN